MKYVLTMCRVEYTYIYIYIQNGNDQFNGGIILDSAYSYVVYTHCPASTIAATKQISVNTLSFAAPMNGQMNE